MINEHINSRGSNSWHRRFSPEILNIWSVLEKKMSLSKLVVQAKNEQCLTSKSSSESSSSSTGMWNATALLDDSAKCLFEDPDLDSRPS